MEENVLWCVVIAPFKVFPESLYFFLCEAALHSPTRDNVFKDEFSGKIIIEDKIFRDCLSAVAGSCEMSFLCSRVSSRKRTTLGVWQSSCEPPVTHTLHWVSQDLL